MKNINNDILEKLDLKIKKSECSYFIKKNGKIKFINTINKQYLCMINNLNVLSIRSMFPYLYDKNEDLIIKKLLILYILQKKDFKYFKIIHSTNKNKNYEIIIFNPSSINNVSELMFHHYMIETSEKNKNFYYGTIIKKLSTLFMLNKLSNNYNNKDILILIFYEHYIYLIESEMYKKYKKNLSDFKNYMDIYIFLKSKGYVEKYYNNYAKKMIKNYDIYYKKIKENDELEIFKKTVIKEIKNFKNINLIKLIDKYINNSFNKDYIKNKFTEIKEKYNI